MTVTERQRDRNRDKERDRQMVRNKKRGLRGWVWKLLRGIGKAPLNEKFQQL